MIHSMKLSHYQSHKDTLLEFSPGVNVITGKSRSGKTAVLRGLVGNRYNKFGLAVVSYWNRDKKKAPINPSSVEICFGDVSVTRTRGPELNGYILSNKEEPYAATRTEVPEDIEAIWNVSDVNIQKQFDQVFLLSDGQTEVARFLNKTIKLDKIDEVLSRAETKRIGTNKDIKKLESDLEGFNKAYAEMSWIDCVAVKIGRAERIKAQWNEKHNERAVLDTVTEVTKGLKKTLESIPGNLDSVLAKIATVEAFDAKIQDKEDKWSTLQNIIEHAAYEKIKVDAIPDNLDVVLSQITVAEDFDSKIERKVDAESNLKDLILDIRQQQKAIKNLPDIVALGATLKLIKDAEDIDEGIASKDMLSSNIKNISNKIEESAEDIRNCEAEILKLTDQMPALCPTCGQSLENCNDKA